MAFHDRLESEFGACLERYRSIEDLFLPEEMQGPFALWSSVVFRAGRAPEFKTYFNPQARGRGQADSLVQEALLRLDMPYAWPALRESVLRRGAELDELKYFALDLSAEPHARVKIYVRHHLATPGDLETASSAAMSYVEGEALHFARAMRGGDRFFYARSPFTCSAYTSEQHERPVATTVYIPVCAFATDDAAVKRRIREYMLEEGLDPSQYERIVDGFANRPLEAGVGMQAWFALRRYRGKARFTVYLATEANHVHQPGTVPAPASHFISDVSHPISTSVEV
jgi:hypothetical protein